MVKIIIVDENDNKIGLKERGTLDNDNDIYRVSGLWVVNSKGDILLAQRGFLKTNHLGEWGIAVSGTVEESESYEENIIKEAEEEIGLKDCNFIKSKKERVRGKYNYFRQLFLCTIDIDIDDFVIQEEELEGLRWYTRDELRKELKETPEKFTFTVKEFLEKY